MIDVKPVRLPDEDNEGVLLFRRDVLLGVLSRLGPQHEEAAGHWYVEAVFGLSSGSQTFPDLDAACFYFETLAAKASARNDI